MTGLLVETVEKTEEPITTKFKYRDPLIKTASIITV